MNELRSQQDVEKNQPTFTSIEQVFEAKTHLPFPEVPSQLPNEITLQPEVYGGLLEAILAQELDDPHLHDNKPRERSQFIGILKANGKLENTNVIVGKPNRTGDAFHELKRWFHPIFRRGIKPLVYWHTHTHVADSPLLTQTDIAQRVAEDRKSVIYLHASPTEITAIFQTKKAYSLRLPISTMFKGFNLYDEVRKFYDSSHDQPRLSDLAAFLEKYGYVLYMWQKQPTIKTVREGVEAGIFLDGIKFNRIGQPKFIRDLKEKRN